MAHSSLTDVTIVSSYTTMAQIRIMALEVLEENLKYKKEGSPSFLFAINYFFQDYVFAFASKIS